MAKKRKMHKDLIDYVLEQYGSGVSGTKIAKRIGVAPPTVYAVLADHGIKCPQPSDPKLDRRAIQDEATEQEVVSDYLSGLSFFEMEKKYGCGSYALRAIVKRYDVQRRNHGGQVRRWTSDDYEKVLDYRRGGMTQQAIALLFGCAQVVISRILIERGVESKRKARGSEHGSWKGGKLINPHGYEMVSAPPNHKFASMRIRTGYILTHRLVMAEHIGRALRPSETVHHINGDKLDNRIENLQLRHGQHGNGKVMVCACCGSTNLIEKEIH